MIDILPQTFKGIALFTPGGDLVYGIDPSKQTQWHAHLCYGLQEILGLADSPHFLVPGYTATVERWFDPVTDRQQTIAEVYPAIRRYVPLLQALFELEPATQWQTAPWQEEHCHRGAIETYKSQFPQLWQQHDLVVRLDPKLINKSTEKTSIDRANQISTTKVYNLRLFISSRDRHGSETLSNIHQLLEKGLTSPYTLKVIDIEKNPEQAANHRIITTPTLIRIAPKPVKRIVGQLDDIPRVLSIISSF